MLQLWDELGVTDSMIVAHVRIEPGHVGDEALPFLRGNASLLFGGLLKRLEILTLEVELEQYEKSGGLI